VPILKWGNIEQVFRDFCGEFSYLGIEEALEFFAFFGGIERGVEIDLFDDLEEVILHQVLVDVESYAELISPSYLLEEPYRKLLIAIARGDGKLLNVFRRAGMSETAGGELLSELIDLRVVELEASRETPLKEHPKHKLKKNLRHYRIQPKIRFTTPFYRFWFGFVEPYRESIAKGKTEAFLRNFNQHQDRCASLSFEQLSNDLLAAFFAKKDPLLSRGSFWDRHSEFDILSVSRSGKIILGECKFKGRRVCKSELNKLREKAIHSNIPVDTYVLFSKNGFSNELLQSKGENLLLFEADDFRQLLS